MADNRADLPNGTHASEKEDLRSREAVNDHPSTVPATNPRWVPLNDQPLFTPRKLRVVCIGAGYAGLTLIYKLKYKLNVDYIDLQVYEKNHDVGGTWLENRYPGVACDVPAHVYTFLFEPNPDWSKYYATGPEIWQYIKKTSKKYQLEDHIQFNTRVVESIWNEQKSQWDIKVESNGQITETSADILVNAAGILNKWKWPEIEGLRDFKGSLLHSAAWDETADWAGKLVGVIGNGSSAIQIVPTLQPKAKRLINYIRSPTWISTNFNLDFAPSGDGFVFSEEQKRKFREHPEELTKYRRAIEHDFNHNFPTFISDSKEQALVDGAFREIMAQRLGNDPELIEKLIPKWQVGCRRLTPGEGYLEALRADNAEACFDRIVRVTETGVETQHGETKLDMLICATGFDVSFNPFWKLVGRDGRRLEDEWAEVPKAYFGICSSSMPNYFIFNGPNCPVGHGSLIAVIDWTADYIWRWCEKIATHDIR
ncbi:hypothetical protein EDD37DRAFT_217336 [Exophiala viscosa]|uniref:uncharacterized protein n=1 Tax=Exophiala viscosa TaxID=2486360 RepID=UPI002192DF50|nr:hypothetical protein EDD37DRAFT_217336 [Exophiala viscosa]